MYAFCSRRHRDGTPNVDRSNARRSQPRETGWITGATAADERISDKLGVVGWGVPSCPRRIGPEACLEVGWRRFQELGWERGRVRMTPSDFPTGAYAFFWVSNQ
jgi:hypothetical protein